MKKQIPLFVFWMIGAVGFSQSLPFPNGGAVLQHNNLDVRWEASRQPWPKTLWTYQMTPTKFSPAMVSNLMALGSFTEKDKEDYGTNGMVFGNSHAGPYLRISLTEGEIEYNSAEHHYNATNLAEDVPGTNELFQQATDFLPKLGIDLSEIQKTEDGKIDINCSEPSHTIYFLNGTFITNVAFRCASFGRLIDGVECDSIVGSGAIAFGERSQITSIRLFWRGVERNKLYTAANAGQIVQWIHQGKAVLPKERYTGEGTTAPIDWSTVKSVIIKEGKAYYWGEFFLGERERRPIFPSPVIPCAALQTTIDTGSTNFDIRIVCPVIDETQAKENK